MQVTDWDLRKLRVLRALSELGTVRATAEALCMTPSAVSQQLSSLAQEVGTPLLESQGRGVRPTEAARVLLRHTDTVLAQLERAEAELEGFTRGKAGAVRVGAFATAIPRLVVPALNILAEERPGLSTRVHQADAAEVYELLAAGEIDIGLSLAAQAPAGPDRRYDRSELLADPLTWPCPPIIVGPAPSRRPGWPICPNRDGFTGPRGRGGRSPWLRVRRRGSYPIRHTWPRTGGRSWTWWLPEWGWRWYRVWQLPDTHPGRCCGYRPATGRGDTSSRWCGPVRVNIHGSRRH